MLEKLALARIQPHFSASGSFGRFQSAYRARHSKETALAKIVNDIGRAAGDGKCTVLLSLDISAAFDTIDHSILFSRLDDVFGIRGTALDWLRSFVTGRFQYIAVGSQRSATCPCISGVRRARF